MISLHILPDRKEFAAASSCTLLKAALKAGIPMVHACGGLARCSTCRVMVVNGLENLSPRTRLEKSMADKLGLGPEIRLACQSKARGPITIRRLVLDKEDYQLTKVNEGSTGLASIGKEQKIAILFADIRGFTSFSESLPSYDVIHVLDRYFHQMGEIIHHHGGYINNYMGDGLMALFEPSKDFQPSLGAVRSAIEMLDSMPHLRDYMIPLYGKGFEIGIGIHYGEAVLGTVGYGPERRRTAIGDSVNLASRIESMNKTAKTSILISDSTRKACQSQIKLGRSFHLPIHGKVGEFKLYEVLGMLKNGKPLNP